MPVYEVGFRAFELDCLVYRLIRIV